MLPIHIIGIPNFFDGLSLKKNEIIKYKIENGKNMFIYQAIKAFEIWHGIQPKITDEVRGLIK